MNLTLLLPRGPLYRFKDGIFKKPIMSAPLTLTSLAALLPDELGIEVEIIDEGIQELPEYAAIYVMCRGGGEYVEALA